MKIKNTAATLDHLDFRFSNTQKPNKKIDIRLIEEGEYTRESGYKLFKQVLTDNGRNFKEYQGIYCFLHLQRRRFSFLKF